MLSPNRAFLAVALVILAGCGENAAEKANRAALVPLLHRNRALTEEFVRSVDNNAAGTATFAQVFEQLDKFKTAKESLQAELRKVVPTERYDCVIALASRSIDADVALLNAREGYYRHQMEYNSDTKLAGRYLAEARSSEYGGGVFLQGAQEQLGEMKHELDQMKDFQNAGRTAAWNATYIGDSLTAVVLSMHLLPSMDRPRYPVVTDSGPDTLLRVTTPAPQKVCVK